MAILMRCVTPYHAGDHSVRAGDTVSPQDPWFIEQFCVAYEVADPAPKKTIRSSRKTAK